MNWCLTHYNFAVGFYLPVYKQCKNLFNRIQKALKPLIDINDVSTNKTELTIQFSNGSSIMFFGSETDSMRSFTYDAIIVDEANFIKEDIWQGSIQPTVAASLSKKNKDGLVGFKGKVLLTSTPKTKNWFYGFIQNEQDNPRIKVIRFTSEEGGIISKDFIDQVKLQIPESTFRNEYMGEFLDNGSGLFKYIPCIKNIESKKGYVAGLDIASKDDYMSLTIQNKQGNVIYQDRWRHQDYDVLLNTVTKILNEYGKPTCYVEVNGIGQVPFEILRKKYGKVKEWVTTNKSKNEIIQKLIVDFNTKDITIPDIESLKDELDNFTCEWKNGKPTYGGSNGFHDDQIMSLSICNYNRNNVKSIKPTLIQNNRRRSL